MIEIEQDGVRGTRLTAGKYLSPRLYASISQPITYGAAPDQTNASGTQQTIIQLEYQINNWMLANLVREGSVLRPSLRWEYSY